MKTVKLTTTRVRYDRNRDTYVNDRIGDVFNVSDSVADRMIEANQATIVKPAARKKSAETVFVETEKSVVGTKTENNGSPGNTGEATTVETVETVETFSNLGDLNINESQLELLMVEDPSSEVPAFESIGQLAKWIATEGNDLTDKKGIGPATAKAIIDSLEAENVKE